MLKILTYNRIIFKIIIVLLINYQKHSSIIFNSINMCYIQNRLAPELKINLTNIRNCSCCWLGKFVVNSYLFEVLKNILSFVFIPAIQQLQLVCLVKNEFSFIPHLMWITDGRLLQIKYYSFYMLINIISYLNMQYYYCHIFNFITLKSLEWPR